jgi:Tol biopolymer transport system component
MKTMITRLVTATLVAMVFSFPIRAADSPSVLLQKGIYAEETEGDVDAAIKIYEQIAAEAATNRAVVAQAQYRLAVCYQKKGNKEQAIVLLKDLLKQSSVDPALNQKTHGLLGDLGQTDEVGLKISKVALPQEVIEQISPDRRFIAFRPQTNPSSVSILDSKTGKTWTVVPSGMQHESLSFSPDERRISYCGTTDNSVYVAGIDGSNPKVVYKDVRTVNVLGWAWDSERIVIIPWDISPLQPKLLEVESGKLTELPALPEGMFFDLQVSPDGRYVTSRALGPGGGRGTISLIDLLSGRAQSRIEKDLVTVVGWSPKRERLLFKSHRNGTIDLWALEVKNGELSGEPELVRRNVGSAWFEVANDDNLYFWESKGGNDVFLASADFETGELTAEPRRVLDRALGSNTQPAWSKDGKTLLLCVSDPPMRFIAVSMESGEQRDYPTAQAFVWQMVNSFWAERDGYILVQSFTSGNQSGLYRFELATGKATPFLLDDEKEDFTYKQPQIAYDGKWVYYIQRHSAPRPESYKPQDRIVRQAPNGGRTEVVFDVGDVSARGWSIFRVSPDGRRLAVQIPSGIIKLVEIDGGASTELLSNAGAIDGITWMPDGKRIVYIKQSEVWSIDVNTRKSVRLQFLHPPINIAAIAIHPDGRQFAFRAGTTREKSELWAMEGFVGRKPAVAVKMREADGKN